MDYAFIKKTGLLLSMDDHLVMLAIDVAVAVQQGEEWSVIFQKFCTLFSFSEKRREHSVSGPRKLSLC